MTRYRCSECGQVQNLSANRAGWKELLGTDSVPLEAAKVIADAVEQMVRRGEVSHKARWQSIEFLCAEYLATVGAE